jgi:hypothetical protein
MIPPAAVTPLMLESEDFPGAVSPRRAPGAEKAFPARQFIVLAGQTMGKPL